MDNEITKASIENELQEYYDAMVDGDSECDELYSDLITAINTARMHGTISEADAKCFTAQADEM